MFGLFGQQAIEDSGEVGVQHGGIRYGVHDVVEQEDDIASGIGIVTGQHLVGDHAPTGDMTETYIFWSQAEASQPAATVAGNEPPVTKPK